MRGEVPEGRNPMPPQVSQMNNTVELGAQDEPLLRCRTLDLHLNVGTKVPYIPGIVCYADSTPTSSGKLKARLTSLYRDAESTLTRYQSPTNGRSVSLITLGGLPYIGNRGSLLHLFTPAGGFQLLLGCRTVAGLRGWLWLQSGFNPPIPARSAPLACRGSAGRGTIARAV
jgi:hypothetical protein